MEVKDVRLFVIDDVLQLPPVRGSLYGLTVFVGSRERVNGIVKIIASNSLRPLLLILDRTIVIGKDQEDMMAPPLQLNSDVVQQALDATNNGSAGVQEANLHNPLRILPQDAV